MQWTNGYTKKGQNNDIRNFTSNTNNRLHYNRYSKCVSNKADNENIPGSKYMSYCFFVVFLSPSWWMPAEYPQLTNNFLSYLSQPTIQNQAPHITHMGCICMREWLFEESDTRWQLPLWSSQQLKRYLWPRWHSNVMLCHINKIYHLSL